MLCWVLRDQPNTSLCVRDSHVCSWQKERCLLSAAFDWLSLLLLFEDDNLCCCNVTIHSFFTLQMTLMFLRHDKHELWWSANWCCTWNIFYSAVIVAIKMSQEERKKGFRTQTGSTMESRKEMKFTPRGGIFNTWPHYGERAQRCVSALLAFDPTMFISENYMILSLYSRPTFCCDIHTVKIRHWINNSHTY